MRSLADVRERTPAALEIVQGTIQTVEADLARRKPELTLLGRVDFSWPFPDNPELIAGISSVRRFLPEKATEYFRVVTLATDERLELDGRGARGISYAVEVANAEDQFPEGKVEFVDEPDPKADKNQVRFDSVSLSRGHGTLFGALELETMSDREIVRRCQMFSAAVSAALGQTPA